MKTIIKGNPISKMDGVKDFTHLDEIIVSKVTQTLSRIPEEIAKSYKISFSDLSTKLISDMKEALHLSSMAYQDVEDYSKITHKHDYSKVKVYPYSNDPELRSVGSISVDGKPYEIRVPDLPEISYAGPQIGEIKMIWAHSFGHLPFVGLYTNVEDRKFNGWVPCDGKEYKKSDFPEAFEYFRTQYDTETFHVPLLSDFFCGNYGNETEDQLKEFPAQTGIGEHSHNGI